MTPAMITASVAETKAPIQHLTITRESQRVVFKTLCGRRWLYITRKPFAPKTDCQACRKIQESWA